MYFKQFLDGCTYDTSHESVTCCDSDRFYSGYTYRVKSKTDEIEWMFLQHFSTYLYFKRFLDGCTYGTSREVSHVVILIDFTGNIPTVINPKYMKYSEYVYSTSFYEFILIDFTMYIHTVLNQNT